MKLASCEICGCGLPFYTDYPRCCVECKEVGARIEDYAKENFTPDVYNEWHEAYLKYTGE